MASGVRSGLIRNTLLYGVFAAILAYLALTTEATIGDLGNFLPYFPESWSPYSLSILLLSLLGAISSFYLSNVFAVAFEGPINGVMVGGFTAGGFISFIALILILAPGSPNLNAAGYIVLVAYATVFAYNVVSTKAHLERKHSLRTIAGSASIFILGQLILQLIGLVTGGPMMPEAQADLIKEILGWGFIAASLIALTGVFKTSRNPYLASIGGITSSYFFVTGISLIGTLYVNFIRGRLAQVSPVVSQLSPYVEWTGVVVIAALIFTIMRRGMNQSMMEATRIGAWARHIQDVSPTKGEELTAFTEIISEFVEDGRRDRLLVKLFNFLAENRVSEAQMTATLRELISHEDVKPPGFGRRGNSGVIEDENKEKRMGVLEITMDRINNLGLGGFAMERGAGTPGEEMLSKMDKMED
jgi:hypothetical protein